MTAAKMQYCVWCGCELGVYAKPHDDEDTCGLPDCERGMREVRAEERERAHEELDRERGW